MSHTRYVILPFLWYILLWVSPPSSSSSSSLLASAHVCIHHHPRIQELVQQQPQQQPRDHTHSLLNREHTRRRQQQQQGGTDQQQAPPPPPLRIALSTLDFQNEDTTCLSEGAVVTRAVDKPRTVTCTAGHVLTPQKQAILVEKILPAATQRIGRALRLTPSVLETEGGLQRRLFIPGDARAMCQRSGHTVPSSHVETETDDDDDDTAAAAGEEEENNGGSGIPDADFVLYVSASPTEGGTLAWALACGASSANRNTRYVAGAANFGPQHISWTAVPAATTTTNPPSSSYTEFDIFSNQHQIDTATHEMIHALGFTPSQLRRVSQTITSSSPGSSSSNSNSGYGGLRGKPSVTIVTSPHVVREFQAYYGCTTTNTNNNGGGIPPQITLLGPELEDEGGEFSGGSHWDRRIAFEELLTASTGNKLSRLTLAFFDDTGFYSVNYSAAEYTSFGRGAGCSFVTDRCDTPEGGRDTWWCFGDEDDDDDGAAGAATRVVDMTTVVVEKDRMNENDADAQGISEDGMVIIPDDRSTRSAATADDVWDALKSFQPDGVVGGGSRCTPDYRGAGVCSLRRHPKPLPSHFQYFPSDPAKGGATYTDKCPVVKAYANRQCNDPTYTATEDDEALGYSYGLHSRCWNTEGVRRNGLFLFSSSSSGGNNGGRCFDTLCVGDVHKFFAATGTDSSNTETAFPMFRVGGEGPWIPCKPEHAGTTIDIADFTELHVGKVRCPADVGSFCRTVGPSIPWYASLADVPVVPHAQTTSSATIVTKLVYDGRCWADALGLRRPQQQQQQEQQENADGSSPTSSATGGDGQGNGKNTRANGNIAIQNAIRADIAEYFNFQTKDVTMRNIRTLSDESSSSSSSSSNDKNNNRDGFLAVELGLLTFRTTPQTVQEKLEKHINADLNRWSPRTQDAYTKFAIASNCDKDDGSSSSSSGSRTRRTLVSVETDFNRAFCSEPLHTGEDYCLFVIVGAVWFVILIICSICCACLCCIRQQHAKKKQKQQQQQQQQRPVPVPVPVVVMTTKDNNNNENNIKNDSHGNVLSGPPTQL